MNCKSGLGRNRTIFLIKFTTHAAIGVVPPLAGFPACVDEEDIDNSVVGRSL